MYLKFCDKISPLRVATLVQPGIDADLFDVDSENQYEWAYINLPGLPFSLDVTRDHGMSEVEDDDLRKMTDEEIEFFPSSGPTYVFGLNRTNDSYVNDIPEWVIQLLCDKTQSCITVYPGRINVDNADPEPIGEYSP